jgi:preprotein translocase subunit SecA
MEAASLAGLALPELMSHAIEHLDRTLAEQKRRLGEPFPLLARYLILTSLDEAWRTHLYTLDDLKGGIGWTAYGGTDPLVAFKRESFVLFQEMLAQTAEKIVRVLLNPRLTITQGDAPEAPPAPARRPLRYLRPEGSLGPTTTTTAPQVETPGAHRPVKAAVVPGRNDPCPCGSGKKYKKCCGADR